MKQDIFRKMQRYCLHLFKILRYGNRIYGTVGKSNHFSYGVQIFELAVVGNHNYFSPFSIVNNAKIGNYCSIGPGCGIGLGEHDMSMISTSPKISNGEDMMNIFDKDNPTTLGNDIWLGANVVVKQGVHIGDGVVVGANAVVTHDIPSYAIAVGVPAKVKRFRFNVQQIATIQKSEWFMCDLQEARERVKSINLSANNN